VFRGAQVSLLGSPTPDSQFHGKDGMGDVKVQDEGALISHQKEHAVNAILRLAEQHSGKQLSVRTA
jgi:inosine-uridine nucleoside N-ribohydrolase